jgi:hypothetical protein
VDPANGGVNVTATEPVPPIDPSARITMSLPTARFTPPYARPAPTLLPSTANCWPGMPVTVSVTAAPGVTAVVDAVSVGCASAASVETHRAARATIDVRMIRMEAPGGYWTAPTGTIVNVAVVSPTP